MRRRRPEKRTINPDPKFNDLQISKFMNYLLTDGKKGIAEKILYDAFDIVQDKSKKDPIDEAWPMHKVDTGEFIYCMES